MRVGDSSRFRQLRHTSMSIIRLDKLLKSSPGGSLGKIIQRARDMDDLTTRLRAELDPETAESLLAANVRNNGELVVVASSSAWAAKLRFESENLLRAARADGTAVNRFRVSVSNES